MKIDYHYLLTLVPAFLFAWLFGGYTGNAIFLIVMLLFIAALIQIVVFSRALCIELDVPDGRLTVRQPVRIAINLENRGIMTVPHVSAEAAELNDRRILSVAARDKESLTYDFLPRVRGLIEVGTIEVAVSDVLNILTKTQKLEAGTIKVYPAVPTDPKDLLAWNTVGEGSHLRAYSRENPYIVRELRRYRPGDTLRKINWKVSAKYNDLFVRRGESAEEKDLLIVLDMNEELLLMDEEGIYENSLVTDALTLSRSLAGDGIRHGFYLNDRRRQYFDIASTDDWHVLEEDLLLHKADQKDTLREFIDRKMEFLHERGTLIFFARPLESDISACERLKHDRNEVVVFAPLLSGSGIPTEGRRLSFCELEGPGYEMA